ncbi:hypothetical protein KYG33_02350 [Chryseobacterium sp. D764]|uniref:hypothetical protein n=1 Tax=unclassified Chryseobacterium TaxID=2593645 RepID=UPI000986C9BD|nr:MULTISPECIES: hypothetical protein [unclassified Chryseobacterium]QXU49912.1 hypothetical protein KYG33_02350 [Chryseobacterium sp. D764]CAD0218123.1 conserved protein of unknown function [Chryseobacterium sp. JV274]
MTIDFTVETWNNLDGMFAILITKKEPGKHMIQVFKKDQDESYYPIDISIKDKGATVLLSINRDPFEGYVVLR